MTMSSNPPRQQRTAKQQIQMRPIIEQPLTTQLRMLISAGALQPNTKQYKMGKCSILVSEPYELAESGWHLSIAGSQRKRASYPSWDEVAHIRYKLVPNDVYMVMVLPPQDDYINLHEYVFQLVEVPEHIIRHYG
jgi:hypothetical protein